jgi:hypothetical protein
MINAKKTLADVIAELNRKRGRADDRRTEAILKDAFGSQPMTEKAARIIELGKIRRGEIVDERMLPKKGSLALKIVNAGRKARGEPEIE